MSRLKNTLAAAAITTGLATGASACSYAMQFPDNSGGANKFLSEFSSNFQDITSSGTCSGILKELKADFPNAKIKGTKGSAYFSRPGSRRSPWSSSSKNNNNPEGVAFYFKKASPKSLAAAQAAGIKCDPGLRGTAYTDGDEKTVTGVCKLQKSPPVLGFPFK